MSEYRTEFSYELINPIEIQDTKNSGLTDLKHIIVKAPSGAMQAEVARLESIYRHGIRSIVAALEDKPPDTSTVDEANQDDLTKARSLLTALNAYGLDIPKAVEAIKSVLLFSNKSGYVSTVYGEDRKPLTLYIYDKLSYPDVKNLLALYLHFFLHTS